MTTPAELLAIAVRHHQAGELSQAMQLYQQVLHQQPHHAVALNLMGVLACQTGNVAEGIRLYQQSLEAKPDLVDAHYNLALALQMVDRIPEAISHFQVVLKLNPRHVASHHNLGLVAMNQGQVEAAIAHFRQALAIQPDYVPALIHCGGLMANVGWIEDAIAHLQKALQLQPDAVQAHAHLGNLLSNQGRLDEALPHFQRISVLQPSPEIHYMVGKVLEEQGQTTAAIAQFQTALKLKPNFPEADWQEHLALPVIYDTPAQILPYRQRFCRELNHLIYQTKLTTTENQHYALTGLGSRTNFYLAYQGLNDRGLQAKYGQFVCRIMAASQPQWSHTSRTTKHPQTVIAQKLRVGYLSAHMMAHSAAAWVRGWMRHHDRDQFDVYSYHIGQRVDGITQEIRELSHVFRHIPGSLTQICPQIIADNLDILVFTDIGMDPRTTQLAGLRLAPVQCTAWGHPVTSGLPTIDYYLSSQLMEPDNAQSHYTENLIQLPNIGISYAKPPLPTRQKPRSDFGLRDDAVVYLCFQAPYKYLPQYDRLFAQIAQQVPNAQFVFLRHHSAVVVERFQCRLEQAFRELGLTSTDYCLFLPKLDREIYWSLNRVADVFLDSLEWSGGNSTLEAIAYGLPVVTYPGKFMRGRHSFAILTMLGVTDTIATTEFAYVAIAVRLGLDIPWRQKIRQRILDNHPRLYDDTECVRALEAFYQRVTGYRA